MEYVFYGTCPESIDAGPDSLMVNRLQYVNIWFTAVAI